MPRQHTAILQKEGVFLPASNPPTAQTQLQSLLFLHLHHDHTSASPLCSMQALVSPTPHSLIPTVTQICAKHTSRPCPATTLSPGLHPLLVSIPCTRESLCSGPAPCPVTFALFPQPQEDSPQPLYSCALCLEYSAPCPPRLPSFTFISA